MLKKCIAELKVYCANSHINIEDHCSFWVIFTGGFSNLYCVEASIRIMLGATLRSKDERFDSVIIREFRSTAITHGATIIAEGNIDINVMLHKNIGLKYFDVFGSEEKTVTLLKPDYFLHNLRKTVYFDL